MAVLYAHHEKKPSAAVAGQICRDFMHVLNKGSVPLHSEAEYVENGKRLPGGTVEARAKDLTPAITQLDTPEPYAKVALEQWWRRRDRCAAQFQGAKAFKQVQDFERATGIKLVDCSPPAMEGKWIHDGLGNRVAATAEAHAKKPDDASWKPTLRDFFLFIASKMLKPTMADNWGQGRWGPTHYIHAYYPASAFEDKTPDVKTWPGSDSCHVFVGKHNKTNAAVCDELLRRKRLCVCDPCFEGKWYQCRSTAIDRGLWYGYRETKQLKCEAMKEIANTRANSTFEGLRSWPIFRNPSTMKQIENVVAVRVHAKDKTQSGEPHYLVKVTRKLRVLTEGGKYESNWYEKGWSVFDATWYHYRGTAQVEGRAIGDRHYTLGASPTDKVTMQLNAVVTGASIRKFSKTVKNPGQDKVFVLSAKDHDKIMEKGALSV